MNPRSLGLRLMGMAAAMVLVALVLAGIVLQTLFVDNLERSAEGDLEAALGRLVALIDPAPERLAVLGQLPDPRYDTPLGGRYWQITDLGSGAVLRSRSLFDKQLIAPVGDEGSSHLEDEEGLHLLLVTREIDFGSRRLQVIVGQDHDKIHADGRRYAWDITRLFGLVGVFIIGIAWAQLLLAIRPLTRLRSAVDEVRRGEVDQLPGSFPSEIQPLVDEVNGLLIDREALAERGRRRASDLAHGLKTPLAALHGIAERLRDKGQDYDAAALDDLAFEMSNRIDYQLRLATLRTRSKDHRENSMLNPAILRTMTVLRKTGHGELLHWVAELGEDIHVDIHRQDLMELIGVTLENASKWARQKIVVRTEKREGQAIVRIADDGPGLPEAAIASLGTRGMRLDERVPGSGLGLAIAKEILELNAGAVRFGSSELGGLQVEISLPLASS